MISDAPVYDQVLQIDCSIYGRYRHSQIRECLLGKAGERVILRGALSYGGVFEFYAREDRKTFTAVFIDRNGCASVLTSGEDLEP